MAIVYDSLLLLGVAFAYGVLVTLLRVGVMGRDELDYVNLPMVFHIAVWLLLWLLLAGYYVLCWRKRGQTLGMKSWRLRLEGLDGRPPGPGQCWLRCLLAPLSMAVLGLGYLWSWFDPRGAWHDRWTKTRVVVLPKPDKKP
jgi:uncharacterized RDD family membrane protein YckC